MKLPELVENNKKYFGTYAVTALLNANTVLDHIQKIAGIEDAITAKYDRTKNAEDLWEHPVMAYLGLQSFSPDKMQLVMDKLQYYFPFLKIMGENNLM